MCPNCSTPEWLFYKNGCIFCCETGEILNRKAYLLRKLANAYKRGEYIEEYDDLLETYITLSDIIGHSSSTAVEIKDLFNV